MSSYDFHLEAGFYGSYVPNLDVGGAAA